MTAKTDVGPISGATEVVVSTFGFDCAARIHTVVVVVIVIYHTSSLV